MFVAGYCRLKGNQYDLRVVGNRAYVADHDSSLLVFDYDGHGQKAPVAPERPDTLFVPAFARGVLDIVLPVRAGGRPEIALYDVRGRQVVRLHPCANDVSGIPAGVYFCRLTYQNSIVCRKVVLAR